jgi:His/Glu/Gln/Arg/opine family amino acid ABC transporter permease subunit
MGQLFEYYLNWDILSDTFPLLIRALGVVVVLLVFGLIFSFILGLILSLMRLSRFRVLRLLSGAYIDFFRGLPLLLLLTFIYYGLGLVGSQTGLTFLILDPIPAAVLALTMCYGAYSAEIFRAGIESIHHGQMEAARSLGMTYGKAMRYVVLPQALKIVVPPLTNELIAMIKDTSLASVIAVPEILFRAREKMGVVANPTPLTAAAIIYVVFTIPLIRLAARLERRQGGGSSKPAGM